MFKEGGFDINKDFKKVFYTLIFTVVFLLGLSFINHQIQLSKEKEKFVPMGQLVEVNGHKMHVYTEGDGEDTFVFMSGGGTSSPVLDFKSLYSLFSNEQYKIAVVEKAGYGFSEVTSTERDIDTILSETREALLQAEIKGPYILVPHSMSGIEALRWAQTYPKEVKAIIGLDMAVPLVYESFDLNIPLVQLGAFAARAGLTRWLPNVSESDAIKYGTLTQTEKELYRVVFYRRTATKNMVNEVKEMKENAQKVKETGIPYIPMLLFTSNGQNTGMDNEKWIESQEHFVDENDEATLIKLNASHYLHNIASQQIAGNSKEFVEKLNQ